MTEKPIPFNGSMVRAILDGKKTQTRRVVQFRKHGNGEHALRDKHPLGAVFGCDCSVCRGNNTHSCLIKCPYGVPGDGLVLLSKWATEARYDHLPPSKLPQSARIWTLWEGDTKPEWCGRTRSSRFVPKRFYDRFPKAPITNIRVKRVQDANIADIIAEGVDDEHRWGVKASVEQLNGRWRALWNSINSKRGYSFESNPYVWIIEFRQLERNTDASNSR